jgi:hypothetical protein
MRFLVLLLACVLLLAASSCGFLGGSIDSSPDTDLNVGGNGNNNNDDDDDNNQDDNAFVVSASAGTTPTYTWEGGDAHSVSVVRADNPANIVWAVAFLGITDGIESGVVHGEVPAGSVEGIRNEAVLTPGVEYRVSVARDNGTEVGWVEFTP